ncbi:MAG: hypothetical protein JW699_06075 [Chitinispirillaceae bacterium]|nr:hypothetical protein [Chitinispirillaceae bacterium]
MGNHAFRKRTQFFPRTTAVIAVVLLSFPAEPAAKIASVPRPARQQPHKTASAAPSPSFVSGFESRMRPFFENRLKGRGAAGDMRGSVCIAEEDILGLVSLWKSLSPEFKTLYKSATQLPDTFDTYVSPGGRFEVYYVPATRDDVNGVEVTDTTGYGVAGDWRTRLSAPNGVPDYIDETAWALDSVWAMEIDRLGFIAPIPCNDSFHTSGLYPVVVKSLGQYDYGYTWPDTAPAGPKGYPSHFELRNRWTGTPWTGMGYEAHPENGIRVTCAHEFFHGVQYAMTWNVVGYTGLDDFPLSWIEGTAVFMEELGFDDVNDYLQYSAMFFGDPGMPFFNDLPSYDMRIYANVLLVKYLYEKNGGIGLIRNVHFTNYDAAVPFHPNLRAASLADGSPWTLLLNRFHAASYYTGTRADTSIFLADAGLFDQWNYRHDTLSASFSVTDSIQPYGMRIFSFVPDDTDRDTADFRLQCAAAARDTAPYPTWGASCIIRRPSGSDSIITLSIDSSGSAALRIPAWKEQNGILLIVTNGAPAETRNAAVYFMAGPGSVPLAIFPNPGRLRAKKYVRFEGSGVREIRIYSMDGTRVAASDDRSFIRYINGFMWQLVNSRGSPVVPGCYTAVVVRNGASGGKKSERHRIMVFP